MLIDASTGGTALELIKILIYMIVYLTSKSEPVILEQLITLIVEGFIFFSPQKLIL